MLEVRPYTPDLLPDWENLLRSSKNGTFLHSRHFMEYHSDRFTDFSLMVYNRDTCIGLFPANRLNEHVAESHSGLTYGGFILHREAPFQTAVEGFATLVKYCQRQDVQEIRIRMLPDLYATGSQGEIEIALHLSEAVLYRVDTLLAVDLRKPGKKAVQARRLRGAANAEKGGVRIEETGDFTRFWNDVLIPNLWERHGVRPVHSLVEITRLSELNTNSIRQFNVLLGDEIAAGITVFETPVIAHAQYIASTPSGRDAGALDYLVLQLINRVFSEKSYFSLGIVNEPETGTINRGLLEWKQGFGAEVYSHRFYRVLTKNHKNLADIYGN